MCCGCMCWCRSGRGERRVIVFGVTELVPLHVTGRSPGQDWKLIWTKGGRTTLLKARPAGMAISVPQLKAKKHIFRKPWEEDKSATLFIG